MKYPFKSRLGINPNSSGHGILWGAMFFLPLSFISLFVSVLVSERLNKALRDYKEGGGEGGP